MSFSYYNRLTDAQKRTYRKSDEIHVVPLPNGYALQPLVSILSSALPGGDRVLAEDLCQKIARGITDTLETPFVQVHVLAARPHSSWGELHGLYEPEREKRPAVITLWMRTAKRRQVVAFRSFLRTLLHEICHHLDYEFFNLSESFHTEGFYQRESSLFKQLVRIE